MSFDFSRHLCVQFASINSNLKAGGGAKGFSLTRDGTQIGCVMRDLLFSQRVTRDFPFIEISVMINII